jgi:hypothetical protein
MESDPRMRYEELPEQMLYNILLHLFDEEVVKKYHVTGLVRLPNGIWLIRMTKDMDWSAYTAAAEEEDHGD